MADGEGGGGGRRGRPEDTTGLGKKAAVRNKTANPQQITAEQLLREAVDRQPEEAQAPRQRIADEDELQMYRVRKRKEFEDIIRRQRQNIGAWTKYAQWEASQQEFRRARSIFERALHVEYQNLSLWLKYLEMEMRNKFVNHARNLFDRVVQLLPRVDQFWYKYSYMEELLGNYAGARTVFQRWMEWEPDDNAWLQYSRFEERCKEIEKARKVMEEYVNCRPTQLAFVRLSKFEEKHNNVARARSGFEKAIELLSGELDEKFYIKFAQFEQRQKEMERAQAIYKLALDVLPKGASDELYRAYVSFEKQHGDRDAIEEVVLNKRRFIYEEAIKQNPRNYDVWFDYVRLEESVGDVGKIREVYERAIANKPPIMQKKFWRRYIYLWIYYALFEELQTGEVAKARAVYDMMIKIVPHKQFSFAKIWKLYAEFEVRNLDLERARKIFGRAIAECQKERIFLDYADLEMRLGNIDRCRTIYGRFLEVHPQNPKAWNVYVDLEDSVGEMERARALCDLAIKQERLDMPELVWKRYIDLEVSHEELESARKVWLELLHKSSHVRVFVAYTEFEALTCESMPNCRDALEKGVKGFKADGRNEERAMLLEHWLKLEKEHGDEASQDAVGKRQPKRVKKRRAVPGEDGQDAFEEYMDYVFPDDAPTQQNLKILEMAHAWKKRKTGPA
jgi:crooked neck